MAVKEKPVKTTQLNSYEKALAEQANIAAGMENSTATGQFFGLASGQLQFNGNPIPGNEMLVVVLDGIMENVYYEEAYDPDDPKSPSCFAFGRSEKDMVPHTIIEEPQHSQCEGCPMNEWASAERGRGKACRNTRRLAMIPAGTFDREGKMELFSDPGHFETAAIAFMKLPVTSVKGYAAFVKQVAGALKRPPHGVITHVKVVPDTKTQFKVTFEAVGKVEGKLLGIIMKRHDEAVLSIDFPYTPATEDDEPKKPAKKPVAKGKAKAAAKKPAGRKY